MSSADGWMSAPSNGRPMWLHPWCWMLTALIATGAAFIWARCTGSGQVPVDLVQVGLLALGLVAAGVSIWMQCAWSGFGEYSSTLRTRALLALAVVHCALAVAVTLWLVLKLGNGGRELPGDLGGTILLWLLTVPWCGWSAYKMIQHATRGVQLPARLETAVLVTQGGCAAFLASWALYWGPRFSDAWDSLRLFLAVLTAAALLVAPLIAARSVVRRIAVSVLITVHFAAIFSAVLGHTPGPWLAAQTQHWIFRPYLNFMYLNNAYRFYSPEPGPASQLWFRLEYKLGNETLTRWGKVPEIDEDGDNSYATSVQLTRRLGLTDAVSHTVPVQWMMPNAKGEMDWAPFVKAREQQTPEPLNMGKLGWKPPRNWLKVPMHPEMQVNYQRPTPESLQMISSYARHLLHQPHPDYPDAQPVAVKIYRVEHRILVAAAVANGADPRDWINYLPYYMGKYNKEGRLVDPHDPFLFWLLPILREDPRDPDSPLRCYFIKHAGDDDWIRRTLLLW